MKQFTEPVIEILVIEDLDILTISVEALDADDLVGWNEYK